MTEEAIFIGVVEQATPAERAAYLDAACGDDESLRSRVKHLLALHAQAGSFMEHPAPQQLTLGAAAAPALISAGHEEPNSRIGPYKLLQQIGEGGMGVVYMAEQERPVHRLVALKVIKPGMDSAAVIARFEAERQALAIMDHPGIARVYDAGATEAGRPYFVMEWVQDGVPIVRYCDDHHLTPRQRLELFVPVCKAVQHAHGKGIIHRDLKPTNVLVMTCDGEPIPKVIDFGIAKALHEKLTDKTVFTQFGSVLGTLTYMSPEQIEQNAQGTDTRSDIYSLGVLLYELLTGSTPLDGKALREAGYAEILKTIREIDPPAPSARLNDSGAGLITLSALRGTEARRLPRLVAGDLDWIVMKCLEKDRSRRYETANGLARDVERYLNDDPVEASPPSASYRVRKFARKHRVGLRVAIGFALVLVAATSVSAWQAVRATRAQTKAKGDRDKAILEKQRADEQAAVAEAVNTFLDEDVLSQASVKGQVLASGVISRNLTIREVLDRAAKRIPGRFDKQPAVEARVRKSIGLAYLELAEYAKAEQQLAAARRLRQQVVGDSHPDAIHDLSSLAMVYCRQGQFARAEELGERAYALSRSTWGEDDSHTFMYLERLAEACGGQRDYAKAERFFEQALEGFRKTVGEDRLETLSTMHNLAVLYAAQGQYAKAEGLFQQAVKIGTRVRGEWHPDTLTSMVRLASIYGHEGQFDKAEALLQQALDRLRATVGERHHQTLDAITALGLLYLNNHQDAKAEPMLRAAYEGRRELLGELHVGTLVSLSFLARACYRQGRLDDAEPLYVRALDGTRKVRGNQHPGAMNNAFDLGCLYHDQQKFEKAQPLLLEVSQWCLDHPEGDQLNGVVAASVLPQLIALYRDWGKPQQAKEWEAKLASLQRQPVDLKQPGATEQKLSH